MTSATPTPCLSLFLTVQRYHLDPEPGTAEAEHPALRPLRQALSELREQGHPAALVQWDGGLFGTGPETFSREWTLHPDIRAETGDVLVRATNRDPFAGELPEGGTLAEYLQTAGCRVLTIWALPDSSELAAAQEAAGAYGLTLHLQALQL